MTVSQHFLGSPLVERLGWTLVHSLWQGAAVAFLLAVVLATLRRRSANVRYLVSCAALVAIALLPFGTFVLLGGVGERIVHTQTSESVAESVVGLGSGTVQEEGRMEDSTEGSSTSMPRIEVLAPAEPQPLVLPSLVQQLPQLLRSILPWAVAGWLAGVSLLSVQLFAGWRRVLRLRTTQTLLVSGVWLDRCTRLVSRLGIARSISFCESSLIDTPMVIGWLKPVVLIPVSALMGLSPQQIEGLLAHELAHIRRHDYLVNLLQSAAETLLFYHPGVWWISRQIRIERENACDDLAAAICGDRVAYARALSNLEDLRGAPTRLALAARGGVLLPRIRRLVGFPAERTAPSAWIVGLLVVLLACIIGFHMHASTAFAQAAGESNDRQEGAEKQAGVFEGELTVRDRNGIVLVQPNRGSTGLSFPFKAMAAHILSALPEYASNTPVYGPGEELLSLTSLDLTIDSRAQFIVETALRKVRRGAAVVVDVQTGDILAAASVPSFDPSSLTDKKLRELSEDPTEPLKNRVLTASAPGATFSLVTALAGVRKKLATATYTCSGGVIYGSKMLSCWTDGIPGRAHHGELRLDDAIKYGCGPFFFQYGNAAGINEISDASRLLGLGMKSGLPGLEEDPGVIPNPAWLRSVNPNERWSQGYTANVSVGQGAVTATPLQMAMVTATLANGGVRYSPRLLLSDLVRIQADLPKLGFAREDIEVIQRGMWKNVNETGGNGSRARSAIVTIAGTTGATQRWREEGDLHHREIAAWFVAYAPYENPRFAVSVRVDGGRSASGTAAPIAARILEQLLKPDPALKPTPLEAAEGSFEPADDVQFSN